MYNLTVRPGDNVVFNCKVEKIRKKIFQPWDNSGHDGSGCGAVASYDEQFKLLNQFNEDR